MSFPLKELVYKSGNVFKNIIAEVIRECSYKNVKINPDVVSFSLLLFFLDPSQGISNYSNISRTDVETFINKTVERITEFNPYMKSLELQFTFLNTSLKLKNENEIAEMLSNNISFKGGVLMNEICELSYTTKDEYDKLFKKIVYDIIIYNKYGRPSDPKVVIETSNALKSVLSREELQEFCTLRKSRRFGRLKFLRKTVCGIMLFNHDDGEYGDEIRNIVKDVALGYKKVNVSINETISKTKILHQHYLNIYENVMIINEDKDLITFKHSLYSDISLLKKNLQLYSQHNYYLRNLSLIVFNIRKNIDSLLEQWNETLKQLHEIVQYRITVPTKVVFPHFVDLSNVWHKFWHCLYLLVDISKLNEKMVEIVHVENYAEITEKFQIYIKSEEVVLVDRLPDNFIGNIQNDCEWIAYSPEIEKTATSINHYCAYLLAIGQGVLIPSDQKIGLLKYNYRTYSFSDIKYARIFANNCQYYENKFFEIVRMNPHLIFFFNLYETIKNYKFLKHETDKNKLLSEMLTDKFKSIEIQTDIHPINDNIDREYTWNIWDLRRKALQLTYLKKCQTHSLQTFCSYCRYSIPSETITNVDNDNQTMATHATLLNCNQNI